MDGQKGPYDLKELKKKSRSPYTMPDGSSLYGFSHDTPENYAQIKIPETPEEFLKHITARYK